MKLPLSTRSAELAAAITSAQARCRVGLVEDPLKLAERVRKALGRTRMAGQSVGLKLEDMDFKGAFWEGNAYGHGDHTMVSVDHYSGISVKRGTPWTVSKNGYITVIFKES